MDHVRKVIEYHQQVFDPTLLQYENIMSQIFLPTAEFAERITITDPNEPGRIGSVFHTQTYEKGEVNHSLVLLEGMILHMAQIWENMVTRDVTLLLAQDTQLFCENFGYCLQKTITSDEAEAIVIGTDYLDFRSFSNIIGHAKIHLSQTLNPFTKEQIDASVRKLIDEFLIIRNHIAHRSRKSLRSYQNALEKRQLQEMEPGQFLLSIPGVTGKAVIFDDCGRKRVFELYIENLKYISKTIVDHLLPLI